MTVSHINPVTESLKLSVACELLATRISTMEVHFRENRGDYSVDDWSDYLRSAKFLNEYYGRNYEVKDVEQYLRNR